jgi:hypothetical protein
MSTNRSNDRACLCAFTFTDGRGFPALTGLPTNADWRLRLAVSQTWILRLVFLHRRCPLKKKRNYFAVSTCSLEGRDSCLPHNWSSNQ